MHTYVAYVGCWCWWWWRTATQMALPTGVAVGRRWRTKCRAFACCGQCFAMRHPECNHLGRGPRHPGTGATRTGGRGGELAVSATATGYIIETWECLCGARNMHICWDCLRVTDRCGLPGCVNYLLCITFILRARTVTKDQLGDIGRLWWCGHCAEVGIGDLEICQGYLSHRIGWGVVTCNAIERSTINKKIVSNQWLQFVMVLRFVISQWRSSQIIDY